MKDAYKKIGNMVNAKVIGSKRECTIGLKPGDEFELSVHKCGEFCGYFYHNIFGSIYTLQFGGKLPQPKGSMQRPDKPDTLQYGGTFKSGGDASVQIWDCPNPHIRVQIELKRV